MTTAQRTRGTPRGRRRAGRVLALALLVLAGCQAWATDEPLEAPERTWTWIAFSGARCMDGTSTGIGFNPSPGSDKVLLFLEGGGACWDEHSCRHLVAHLGGFGEAEFQRRVSPESVPEVLDRDSPHNPFREWNLVYVPYCSGDVHAGDNPEGWNGLMHLGYRNLGLYLERLVPGFAGASQVVLAGVSAGGLGASFNFDRVQRAFGEVPVTLLNDSGVALSEAYMRPCLQAQWREVWNLDATLPADCVECREEGGLVRLLPHLARKYPERRFGMIASTWDEVMRRFFSYGYGPDCHQPGQMPAADFEAGVTELREETLAPFAHFRLYTPRTTGHVFLERGLGETTVSGVPLKQWVEALVEGAPDWSDVAP